MGAAFDALSNELLRHMDKEGKPPPNPFGTILNPIRAMEHEHREARGTSARAAPYFSRN